MPLIRPRLTDYYGIHLPQAEVDFAIPFFDEDLPLYVDPFLLWKSPSYQDNSLHTAMLNSFNHLGYLLKKGKREKAVRHLILASECDEVGLGVSSRKRGKKIGEGTANEILQLFEVVPEYDHRGFRHFEEIQFFVEGISKDRISDFACSFMKSFLIDFTISECERLGVPLHECTIPHLYNVQKEDFDENVSLKLPIHPENGGPIILVPKRWLRFNPWLNFDEYFRSYCPRDAIVNPNEPLTRVKVLNYNRDHYGVIEEYIREKERTFEDCKNNPLFSQIPVTSARRKMKEVLEIPTATSEKADRRYEDAVCQLMASLLYPHLDFATAQSRTDSGVLIRDLIFYNNRSHDFLREMFDEYGSRQIVMEMKNVMDIEREHINELNRYLTDDLGKFGVLIVRREPRRARRQNVIDLWSGQRRCIVTITDQDLSQMAELFESKQRLPLDVLKKKYVELRRQCPS